MRSKLVLSLVAFIFIPSLIHAQGPAVNILQDFRGTTLTTSPSGGTFAPPDSEGTVGPNNFIELINGSFSVFNKTGNPVNGSVGTPITRITDAAFWNGITHDSSYTTVSGISDPRVIFDKNTNRYYATEITVSNTSNVILLARTEAGADPSVLSNWKATSFVGRSGNFVDYPMLGIDANAVYIGSQDFTAGNGSFLGTSIRSIPKSDLTAATPSAANRTLVTATSSATYGNQPHPVVDYSPTKGAGVILGTLDGTSTLKVVNPTGTGAAGAIYSSVGTISTASYTTSPNYAPQPDGTLQLDNLDSRFGAAPYQVGTDIWAVHAVAGSGTTSARSVLQWFHINSLTNTVLASGILQDAGGHFDYFNGSIAANANGVVVISLTRSGDNTTGAAGNAGHYALVGTTVGSTTTFGSLIQLQGGLVNNYHLFGGNGERWGDFSAVTVDPNDDSIFWLANEYAVASNNWGMNISSLQIAVPEPTVLAMISLTGVSGAIFWIRRRRKLQRELDQQLMETE